MGCGSSSEAKEAEYQYAVKEKKQEEAKVQAR